MLSPAINYDAGDFAGKDRPQLVSNTILRLIKSVGRCCEDGHPGNNEALETGVRGVIGKFGLASFCIVALVGTLATKVVSIPGPQPAEAADRPATAGTDPLWDTLTKADKFAVVYVVQSPADVPHPSIPSTAAQAEPTKPKPTTDAVSRDRPASVAKKVAFPLPKPRPRINPAKHGIGIESAKAAPDIKACRHQDAIAAFLISAGIAPRCET
jgi:hypothetical protein